MAIEICGVKKRFGETTALDGVTVTFEEGRIYGLLGNNGAGKSTLLNILTGRLPGDAGTVTVDGTEVDRDSALEKLFLASEKNMYPDDMKVRGAFRATGMFYPHFDLAEAEALARQFGLNLRQKGQVPVHRIRLHIPPDPGAHRPHALCPAG